MMTRRRWLGFLSSLGLAGSAAHSAPAATGAAPAPTGGARIQTLVLPDAQWRQRLTPAQYKVLREEGTETAGTSPLNGETRNGHFHCAGCDLGVYRAAAKFYSGTGWPSFWESVPGAVGTKDDPGLFGSRTEVHCARCGGHLGHVFDDGPQPTGKRHCINGVALAFRAA